MPAGVGYKNVELPDGRVIEFPGNMSDKLIDSQIRFLMAREAGVQQATRGAQERSAGAPLGPADPAFYGDPEDTQNIIEAGKHRGTAAAAGPSLAILGAGTAVGSAGGVAPFLKGAALSVAGGFAGKKAAETVGAPPWVGSAAGMVAAPMYGPKIVTGLLSGKGGLITGLLQRIVPAAEQRVAATAAKGLSGPEAAKAVELKLAQLAEKRSAREAAAKLAERRISVAEERNQLLRMRLEGKAPSVTRPAPAPTDPSATMPPTPAASVSPPRLAPQGSAVAPASSAELQAIVLKIQQTATSSTERKVVREWLASQPKEVASQIRLMLARRQAKPATVYTKPSGEDPSADLARMLGQ